MYRDRRKGEGVGGRERDKDGGAKGIIRVENVGVGNDKRRGGGGKREEEDYKTGLRERKIDGRRRDGNEGGEGIIRGGGSIGVGNRRRSRRKGGRRSRTKQSLRKRKKLIKEEEIKIEKEEE